MPTKTGKTWAKPATCHPDQPRRGRGLCNACYLRARAREKGIPALQIRPPGVCPHPDRPVRARGMCSPCYRYDMAKHRIDKKEDDIEYIVEDMEFLNLTLHRASQMFKTTPDKLAARLIRHGREDLVPDE